MSVIAARNLTLWLGSLALGFLTLAAAGQAAAAPAPPDAPRPLTRTYRVGLTDEGANRIQEQMADAIARRLAALGTITAQCEPRGTREIVVRVTAPSVDAFADIPALLQKQGGLELRPVHPQSDALLQQGVCPPDYVMMAEYSPSNQAARVHLVAQQPSGPAREEVTAAKTARDPSTGQETIEIAFSNEGATLFAELTRARIGERIALVVDDQVLLAPVVRQEIQGGHCVLTGNFSPPEARRLAALIAHPLPAPVDSVSVVADASPLRVSIEVKLIELRGEDERTLTIGRLLDAQPAPSATNISSARAQRLAMRSSLKDDPHFSAILATLDAPQTNRTAELAGNQLDWPGRHLTNAANMRLSAELGPAASAVLTDSQCRLLVRALEQDTRASVFSTPRVTVASGQQTRVQMVNLVSVRTGIHPDAVVAPGVWVRTNTPVYTLAQVPVGPSLDLAPIVLADAQGIDLTVTVTLTEFLGYDPPIRSRRVQVWKNGAKTRVDTPLPRFRVRQMQAPVRLEDGQTVLLATRPEPDLDPTQRPDSLPGRVSSRKPPPPVSQRFLVFLTPRLVHPVAH